MSPGLDPSSLRLSLLGVGFKSALALVGLVNVVILARALGPEGRGEYFLFVASLAVLTRLLDPGLATSTVVYVARGRHAPRDVHQAAVQMLAAIWGVAVVGITCGVAVLGQFGIGVATWSSVLLLAGLLAPSLYEQIWNHLSIGLRAITRLNAVHLASGGLALCLNLALSASGALTVTTALAVFAGVLLAKAFAMHLLARRRALRPGPLSPPGQALRHEMLHLGIRSYPNSVAALLWARIPAFVLLPFSGTAAVGLFSVSQQAIEQLALPLQAIQDATYRDIAGQRKESAPGVMNRILRFAFWGLVPFAFVGVVVAPLVFPLVYGPAFGPSARIFQLLVLGMVASIFPVLLSPFFFAQLKRPLPVSVLAWLKVVLVLVLCLAFIPPYGEVGAAVAVVLTELTWSLLTVAAYVRTTRSKVADLAVVRVSDVQVSPRRVLERTASLLTKRTPG